MILYIYIKFVLNNHFIRKLVYAITIDLITFYFLIGNCLIFEFLDKNNYFILKIDVGIYFLN